MIYDLIKPRISYKNPLRYVDASTINYNYKLGAFDDTYYSTAFNSHKYKQKFAIGDRMKTQIMWSEFDDFNKGWQCVPTARIMDFNGVEYMPLLLVEKLGVWNDYNERVYEFDKELTASNQGNFYVEIKFTVRQTIPDGEIYEAIFISEPWECASYNTQLMKIKYRRSENDTDFWLYYDTGIEFELRAELLFNQTVVVDPKAYADQKQDSRLTDVVRSREREIKNTKPLPYWMIEKIGFAVGCEELKLFEPNRTLNDDENYYYTLTEFGKSDTIFDFEISCNCSFKVRENDMKTSCLAKCWNQLN